MEYWTKSERMHVALKALIRLAPQVPTLVRKLSPRRQVQCRVPKMWAQKPTRMRMWMERPRLLLRMTRTGQLVLGEVIPQQLVRQRQH
jgi:hypothetical protein